jgi:hypothetical protein
MGGIGAKMAKPAGAVNTSRPLTNQRKDRFMATPNLTASRLREVLRYDPETGVFTAAVSSSGKGARRKSGDPVGGPHNRGYWSIRLGTGRFLAHRLAWLYMTGEWPTQSIDHINGIKDDNRWANLRDVSHFQNMQNLAAPMGLTSSGLLGVTLHARSGRWYARITTDGNGRHLGSFSDKAEAEAAYLAAKRSLHSAPRLFGISAS